MSDDTLIEVSGVSKKFARTMRRSMIYGLRDVLIDSLGIRARPGSLRAGEFWAVRDVSFELQRGEVLGVIGSNGSGKTTLLSMLNGIFSPDRGKIAVTGNVGALIQLGAGFHPMLTGRENVYINGSVLGMSNDEIDRKFDDIVEFAGVHRFIDTPVKYYSSGMYARLGFSVAVHLEPDVLLVDEVLSVGDAEFRAKAMDRMWSLVSTCRSAVVFVSHNMVAVRGFCQRLLLLEGGVAHFGRTDELIAQYLGDDVSLRYEKLGPKKRDLLLAKNQVFVLKSSGEIEIRSVRITNDRGTESHAFRSQQKLVIHVDYCSQKRLENVVASIYIVDPNGLVLATERSMFHGVPQFVVDGPGSLTIEMDPIQLKSGTYILGISFQEPTMQNAYGVRSEDSIRVVEDMPNPGGKEGFFTPRVAWIIEGQRHSKIARPRNGEQE